MELDILYEQYLKSISDLLAIVSSNGISQSNIDQEERQKVAEIEKSYMQVMTNMAQAKEAVTKQYHSVWESCTSGAGLKKPEDQRPAPTDLSLQDAIKVQEAAASKIHAWFERRSQQAILERQRKLQQEASRRAAIARSEAEEQRQRQKEAAAAEEARGSALLEEMKKKYRNN